MERFSDVAFHRRFPYRIFSKLKFDILTYGILAMRVNTPEAMEAFMSRMDRHDTMPNEVIMSTLLNNLSRNFKLSEFVSVRMGLE